MQQTPTEATSAPSYMYDQPGDVRSSTADQQVQWVVVRTPVVVSNYNSHHSIALGITLIVTGALSVICNIADLAMDANSNHAEPVSIGYIGHGFWAGVPCIVAGGVGIGAGSSKTVCSIRCFMVMDIVAACTCLGQLITGITGASLLQIHSHFEDEGPTFRAMQAMEALLAVLAIVGGVAAIWGSRLGCKAARCCLGGPSYTHLEYVVPMTHNTQQLQQHHQQPVPSWIPAPQPGPGYPYNGASVATEVQKTDAPLTPSSDPSPYDSQ